MDQNPQPFNLSDVAELIKRRKTFIFSVVIIAVAITTAMVFFVMPKYYKSTAVVIAANPVLADKAHLFNDNVEGLYSAFGGEDDLNRIYGIAKLDTTYKLLVRQFNLVDYYEVKENNVALKEKLAVLELKEDVDLIKNDLYQLKISATTKDKNLSADIANKIVETVQSMSQDLWKKSYENVLDKITVSSTELELQYNQLKDSSGNQLTQVKLQTILSQLQQNEKTANQYKVALSNNTPSLIVLEKAYPSAKADKPQKLLIILAAFLSALAFSILIVLLLERRR